MACCGEMRHFSRSCWVSSLGLGWGTRAITQALSCRNMFGSEYLGTKSKKTFALPVSRISETDFVVTREGDRTSLGSSCQGRITAAWQPTSYGGHFLFPSPP
jgi:hypothetical protein